MSARTCATAFTRRLLYSRGTPGIVMPVAPTAGAVQFGGRWPASQRNAYRGCGDQARQGPAAGVVKLRDQIP